jgi:hypothetical protein
MIIRKESTVRLTADFAEADGAGTQKDRWSRPQRFVLPSRSTPEAQPRPLRPPAKPAKAVHRAWYPQATATPRNGRRRCSGATTPRLQTPRTDSQLRRHPSRTKCARSNRNAAAERTRRRSNRRRYLQPPLACYACCCYYRAALPWRRLGQSPALRYRSGICYRPQSPRLHSRAELERGVGADYAQAAGTGNEMVRAADAAQWPKVAADGARPSKGLREA